MARRSWSMSTAARRRAGAKFPRATSPVASRSSAWSATIRFSRTFSFSRSFSRFAASAFMPPYWLRQRCSVRSDTSTCFATSPVEAPSPAKRSASRSLRMICPGVCRLAISRAFRPSGCQTLADTGPVQREQASTMRPSTPDGQTPERFRSGCGPTRYSARALHAPPTTDVHPA